MTTTTMSAFPVNFFEHLQGASSTATLSALSAFSRQRNFDAMNAFITHAEQHGLGSLAKDLRMTVLVEQTEGELVVQERFTQTLARTLAPPPCRSHRLKDATMLAAAPWTAQQADFFDRCIGLLSSDMLSTELLARFAFDMAGLVPHAPAMDRLLDLGVSPASKMAAQKGDDITMVREAILWGNLEVATLLIKRLPEAKVVTMIDEVTTSLSMSHASLKEQRTRPETLRMIQIYMDKDEPCVQGAPLDTRLNDFLKATDEKAGEAQSAALRTVLLDRYLEMCTRTVTAQVWTPEGLALVMGARPGQALGETATAHYICDPTHEKGNVQRVAIVQRALHAHCKDVLQACATLLASVDNNYFKFPVNTVNDESRTLTINGASRPQGDERFRDTLTFMASLGHDLNGADLLHTLARNKKEDKLRKLAIVLDLCVDPWVKNSKGRTPSTTAAKGEARDEWNHVVHAHQARCVSRQAIEKMIAGHTQTLEKSQAQPGL